MKYKILNQAGEVVNVIMADAEFMAANFPQVLVPNELPAVEGEPEPEPQYWNQYQAVLEPVLPPTIPAEVLQHQARLVLLDAGLLDQVDTVIAAIPVVKERRQAEILWNHRPTIRRDSTLVASLGSGLGLTESQIDDLFIAAKQVV